MDTAYQQADHPLQPLVARWLDAIRAAFEAKERRFGRDAAEGARFFSGEFDVLWKAMKADRHFRTDGEGGVSFPEPPIKMTINKVAEFVQLFGPAIFSRNPVRTVSANAPFEPPGDLYAMLGGPQAEPVFMQAQQTDQLERRQADARALLLQTWLNYTPAATDLRGNARAAVTEALVKGAGVLWPQVVQPPGSPRKLTGCLYDSIDNLFIDPDADTLANARWCARRVVEPQWQAERRFNLPPGTLGDSAASDATGTADAIDAPLGTANLHKRAGKTTATVVYWEIYSKMGAGGRLSKVPPDLAAGMEAFGDFCKLVVCDNCPFFLNVPPTTIADPNGVELAKQAMQWDTPYYADGGWPFVMLFFHEANRSPWPLSHLAPAMGELKFLNWAFGHLAAKVRSTSRDFIACLESAGEEIKQQILHGGDLELLQIKEAHGKSINEIVQFLQHPAMNGDIWRVIEAVMDLFDKRTGLTELVYGQSGTQMRSGTEAKLKGDQMSIRPDDMAECIEAALSTCGRMEALCARWHLTPDDVRPVLGSAGADWWGQLLYTTDPAEVIYNLAYRVESGTAKKPNKARDLDNATAAMNQMFPPLFQYAQATGQMSQVNALIEFWAKANDMPNPDAFKLSAPPPMPPAPGPGPGGPPPGGAAPAPGGAP